MSEVGRYSSGKQVKIKNYEDAERQIALMKTKEDVNELQREVQNVQTLLQMILQDRKTLKNLQQCLRNIKTNVL